MPKIKDEVMIPFTMFTTILISGTVFITDQYMFWLGMLAIGLIVRYYVLNNEMASTLRSEKLDSVMRIDTVVRIALFSYLVLVVIYEWFIV